MKEDDFDNGCTFDSMDFDGYAFYDPSDHIILGCGHCSCAGCDCK